jgi:hypothetical protein
MRGHGAPGITPAALDVDGEGRVGSLAHWLTGAPASSAAYA